MRARSITTTGSDVVSTMQIHTNQLKKRLGIFIMLLLLLKILYSRYMTWRFFCRFHGTSRLSLVVSLRICSPESGSVHKVIAFWFVLLLAFNASFCVLPLFLYIRCICFLIKFHNVRCISSNSSKIRF